MAKQQPTVRSTTPIALRSHFRPMEELLREQCLLGCAAAGASRPGSGIGELPPDLGGKQRGWESGGTDVVRDAELRGSFSWRICVLLPADSSQSPRAPGGAGASPPFVMVGSYGLTFRDSR